MPARRGARSEASEGDISEYINCCLSLICCIAVIVFVLVIVLPITFTRRSGSSTESLPVFYTPGDSRIVSYSSFFCAGITLTDRSVRIGSSLYLIRETPPLTDRNELIIPNSSVSLRDNTYIYWNYYLYPITLTLPQRFALAPLTLLLVLFTSLEEGITFSHGLMTHLLIKPLVSFQYIYHARE